MSLAHARLGLTSSSTKWKQDQNCQKTKLRIHCSWDSSGAKPSHRPCPWTTVSSSCPWMTSEANGTHVQCFSKRENNLDLSPESHQSNCSKASSNSCLSVSNPVLHVPSLVRSNQLNCSCGVLDNFHFGESVS